MGADVDLDSRTGIPALRGTLLTPGGAFEPADLPCPAVLLEYAGRIRVGDVPGSRYSFAAQWVLWRFNFATSIWVEVVRAVSNDSGWTANLAPIAHRLLYAERTDNGAERARPESARITAALSTELAAMTSEMRCHVLAALDIYVANEIVRSAVRPLELRTRAA